MSPRCYSRRGLVLLCKTADTHFSLVQPEQAGDVNTVSSSRLPDRRIKGCQQISDAKQELRQLS